MADPDGFWKRVRDTENMCITANVPFPPEKKLSIAEGVFQKTGVY